MSISSGAPAGQGNGHGNGTGTGKRGSILEDPRQAEVIAKDQMLSFAKTFWARLLIAISVTFASDSGA